MNWRTTYPFFIFLFGFSNSLLFSQKKVDHQSLSWIGYQAKLNLHSNWQLAQEIEDRIYIFPFRQHQLYFKTSAYHTINSPISVGAGLVFMNQYLPQLQNQAVSDRRLEIRPSLEIQYRYQLSEKFELNERYIGEFRFQENEKGKILYANHRSRLSIELGYQATEKIKVRVYDEIMLNAGKEIVHNVFDQNRAGLGVKYKFSKLTALEIGYFNWYQQRQSGDEFYQRDIIRITLSNTFDLNKKNKIN